MYRSIVLIIIMTILGFVIFDSIAVAVAFGIGVGSILGIIFPGENSDKEESDT